MALKAFHNANPQATGPPVRLKKWTKAAEEDHFIEDYEDDNILVANTRGQASCGGGSDVIVRHGKASARRITG